MSAAVPASILGRTAFSRGIERLSEIIFGPRLTIEILSAANKIHSASTPLGLWYAHRDVGGGGGVRALARERERDRARVLHM